MRALLSLRSYRGRMSVPEWVQDLVSWAWARHHNVLSWYIRPLFLLPYCYFAYRRSAWGILLTLLALVTSMAWFPAPEQSSPGVQEMLDAERDYLLSDWTPVKVLIGLLVPLIFLGVAVALWRRSVAWALVVINGAVLFKVVWTFWFSGTEGALTHLPAALIGLALVDAVVLLVARCCAGARPPCRPH
ncbi:hypothetical protein GCM10010174_04660 [Kutzneria viridogrisea]